MKIKEVFSSYVVARTRHGASSMWRAQSAWKKLAPTFGERSPETITTNDLYDYLDKRVWEDGVSRSTVTLSDFAFLRAAMYYGSRTLGLNYIVPTFPDVVRATPRSRILTHDEVSRIAEGAEGYMKTFVYLAIFTAGRHRALLELTWERVDLKRGIIFLNNPELWGRRKPRATVKISKILHDYLSGLVPVGPWVIEDTHGNRFKSLRHGFDALLKRVGVEKSSPHVLRHTAAAHMAMRNVPMYEISKFLGHKSIQVTQEVYATFVPDFQRQSTNALDNFFYGEAV